MRLCISLSVGLVLCTGPTCCFPQSDSGLRTWTDDRGSVPPVNPCFTCINELEQKPSGYMAGYCFPSATKPCKYRGVSRQRVDPTVLFLVGWLHRLSFGPSSGCFTNRTCRSSNAWAIFEA